MPSLLSFSTTSGRAAYQKLLSYTRPYRWVFIISVIAMGIYALTETGLAALMKPLMDGSFVRHDPVSIHRIPIFLVSLFVIRGIANFTTDYGLRWIARRVVEDLREKMFSHLLTLPAHFYDINSSGQILSKLIYDVEQVSNAATDAVLTLIRDSLTIVGLLAWMVYLNGLLALIILITAPIISGIVWFVSHRFRRISQKIQTSMGSVCHLAQESIEGHLEVKVFGGQSYELQRFKEANKQNREQAMKMVVVDSISQPIIQIVAILGLAEVIHLSTEDFMLTRVSIGTFISFITAMMMLMGPIKRITKINGSLQRGIAAAQSVFHLLEEPSEVDHGKSALKEFKGAIKIENLCFGYKDHTVLKNINLEVMPGQIVALVGHSGSGKSTLVGLLARFYEINSGKITFDGIDTRELRLAELRKQISLVSQQIVLFNDTIARNIAYGSDDAEVSREDIVHAAKTAHAMEFIDRLPQGLDTIIGDNGVLLSGGQRQRLAIARALLKNAPLLILDEATASLDTESERHIQAALEALMYHRTTVVIAHRLSTVENADKIVVLQQGRIIEMGTHSQLLEQDNHYAELYRLQFRNCT
ncbi:lipid A export permease/ATP-binding protein MsbA [Candidatus Nitrosacidococcus tergens]|uniref:Fused lipid transporter subunits of ABC superfamily: membrane component ATP-binding component n=1 Tax=Candidatus Nitrosacidococcus tergens TaxID=553981 RepID=A0A7G1QBB3_9GAMM|nr:lipid A export permease/ATP-binding protein MsbA [Candidatus Nitrosacidococcus tergens]CAB1277147.1 fused lipid transporter subunits of ABC superfamily: membrane component; ATP-binding component [Candidatus Nitrosacidococcus tergens]